MLSKNLENSTSYDIFYKFWKKARVYYTLSISRGGGAQAPGPPPGFATDKINNIYSTLKYTLVCTQLNYFLKKFLGTAYPRIL